jgi:hypothetical protein
MEILLGSTVLFLLTFKAIFVFLEPLAHFLKAFNLYRSFSSFLALAFFDKKQEKKHVRITIIDLLRDTF